MASHAVSTACTLASDSVVTMIEFDASASVHSASQQLNTFLQVFAQKINLPDDLSIDLPLALAELSILGWLSILAVWYVRRSRRSKLYISYGMSCLSTQTLQALHTNGMLQVLVSEYRCLTR